MVAGLFDGEINWPVGEPRPRYLRYKMLTSLRQEGTVRFSTKDFAGLGDGDYFFSLDTGNLASIPSSGCRAYCVSQVSEDNTLGELLPRSGMASSPWASIPIANGMGFSFNLARRFTQRIRVRDCKVTSLVGRAHGCPLPPAAAQSISRTVAALKMKCKKINGAHARGSRVIGRTWANIFVLAFRWGQGRERLQR